MVEWYLEGGYFLTIFGHSAPLTDVDARDRILGAVQARDLKRFLQLEVIDPAAEKLLHGNLAPLVGGGVHYPTGERLDHSWMARHPRLTCEALFQATMMLEAIIDYRMPGTEDLSELQEWARDFQDAFPEWLDEGYDGQDQVELRITPRSELAVLSHPLSSRQATRVFGVPLGVP
jgi:hypothetical protein